MCVPFSRALHDDGRSRSVDGNLDGLHDHPTSRSSTFSMVSDRLGGGGVSGRLAKAASRFAVWAARPESSSNEARACQPTLGQPTHDSHPHLVAPGHCAPGFTAEEFALRRQRLFELLCDSVPSAQQHLIVIPSASHVYMTEKIPYSFRQNSNFYYLSGFAGADSVLVIEGERGERAKATLFVPKHDSQSELWNGPQTSPQAAIDLLKIDSAHEMDEVESFLSCFPKAMLWMQKTNFKSLDHLMKGSSSPESAIHTLRLIKSDSEIAVMQRAADITCKSFKLTMESSHPFVLESQLAAKFEFESQTRGSERCAYPCVVAGGDRANIIHYLSRNQVIRPDELVLMDAGAELHLYASDVTRTWPVNGRFTQAQRDLYELVVRVHEHLLDLLLRRWPAYTLDGLFQEMCTLIGRGLMRELRAVSSSRSALSSGLLSGGGDAALERRVGFRFCPHHVSHYLGMDVHDTPSVSRAINLRPGMVFTVEPGVYVPRTAVDVAAPYRGIGVRIEDDLVITEDGEVRLLSRNCPRSADEVEALVGCCYRQ